MKRIQSGDIFIFLDDDRGRWVSAFGPSFPTAQPGTFPRPHSGAVFFRTDLGAHYLWDDSTSTWTVIGGGGGAPTAAEYLVGALDATLSAERLVTDTATVTWDLSTPGTAKANTTNSVNDNGARFLAMSAL